MEQFEIPLIYKDLSPKYQSSKIRQASKDLAQSQAQNDNSIFI